MKTVLPDGTYEYRYKGKGGVVRYKPPENRRKWESHKPDDPRAVRFHALWFLPLDLVSDKQRVMPETRPDVEAYGHKMLCRCDVCQRPAAVRMKQKALRHGWSSPPDH